jgi:hypothetical protein
MTTNAVIGWLDRVVAGSVTASSEWPGGPAVNVQTAHPGQQWITDGTPNASIVVDFGGPVPIDAVYLGNHNINVGGNWRVRLSLTDSTGTLGEVYDSGLSTRGISTRYALALEILPAQVTAAYLRVDLFNNAASDLRVGRLWAGELFRPSRNFQFGARRPFNDFSNREQGSQGQQWVMAGAVQRAVNITFPAIPTSEAQEFGERIAMEAGLSSDILLCLNPDAVDLGRETFFGLAEELAPWEMAFPGYETTGYRITHRL